MNALATQAAPTRFSHRRIARRRVLAGTGLALAALLLGSAVPAAPLAAAANAQGPTTIRISYQPIFIAAPLILAKEKGYFEQAGLDVQLIELWTSPEILAGFASGQLDAGAGGFGPAQMNAVARNALNVRLVAPLHSEKPPVATPLVVRKTLWDDGQVRSVADLKGRKVAINSKGSAVEYWLYAALAKGSLTPDDVDVVVLSFPDAAAALANGAIDAALIGEPIATMAEQDGTIVRLSEDFVDDIQVTAVYFDNTFLNGNRPAVEKFVAAYLRGARDLQGEGYRSPENLAVLEKVTKVPAATIAQTRVPFHDPNGQVHVEDFQKLHDFFVQQGVVTQPIDMASIIDQSVADAAVKMLAQGAATR